MNAPFNSALDTPAGSADGTSERVLEPLIEGTRTWLATRTERIPHSDFGGADPLEDDESHERLHESQSLRGRLMAEALVSSRLPAVRPSDAVADVLSWMEDLQTSHLPVVENRELLGLTAERDLLDVEGERELLSEAGWIGPHGAFVYRNQHAYDVVSLMHHTGHSVVPVLDHKDQYVGSIGREEVLRYVGEMLAVTEPGGVIVLEMGRLDYSLREIASIVESNGARIVSVYLASQPESDRILVTLKLSQSELTPILMSFERFNYHVAYSFVDAKQADDTRDRYDALIRYLNI